MINEKKKVKLKFKTWLFLLFGIIFLSLNFVSAFSYNWNFSTASDYTYNSTQIIVSGGIAYINGTTSAPIYAWWHLNENTGTNIGDSSGNNRNGTAMASPSWVTGKLSSALQFNGLNQYVDFGNSTANFERTQAFSVELWFKTANTGQQILLSKMQSTGNYAGWEIYYDGTGTNRMFFDLSNIATTNHIRVYCSPSVVADNNWHHLVVTYDGSSNATGVNFYFDGSPKTTGITYNTLTASILTSTPFQLSGRGNGAMGIVGLLDEVVIYNGVLTSDKVTSRYNSGNGTETAVGDYPIGYYTIQPKNNFSYSATLMNFIETATKTNSEIQYIITTNGVWKYWNGTSWTISNGNWTQSNSASDIATHISTIGSSGNFTFKAILHSTDGTYTPYLDNIEISECSENWIVNYTNCNIFDNNTKYYYDSNNCGTFNNLPADNGTSISCDYCTPNWYCSVFDNVCENSPYPTWLYCLQANDTHSPTCCQQTGLGSDCNSSLTTLSKPCGNISQYLNVPSYPYVDLNTSYPMQYFIYLNDVASYVGNVSIDVRELDGNTSNFNFTWNNADKSYDLTLLFTEIGNYPFTIYTYYPYIHNLTGEFLVRQSYNVTFCGFNQDDDYASYENDYAYLIAEFTSSKKYYNDNLEQFITPLGFKTTFKTPVFHTLYRNGCGTFKLYEADEYVVRLFDGIATFQTTFSQPNITKTYGTNIYFGKYALNGTDTSYNVLFTNKDIRQFTWLFNTLFVVLLIAIVIISIFMFFVIIEKPYVSIIFGLGFSVMLVIARIVIWFYWG